jgi:8-oxo-dGTP pyrophosphatase MutT (NUDIX family)
MDWDDVQRALTLPRPGRSAHARMSPRPRPGDVFPLPPDIRPKEAGVLILLYPVAHSLCFLLTRRSETVEMHKGQISFPGGAQEPGETIMQTVLREAQEELSFETAEIDLFPEPLTPVFIPISRFRMIPFVGYATTLPELHAEPNEVVEIIETPIDVIINEKNIGEEDWNIRGQQTRVPFYAINGHKVWGATAMVLSEFAELLRQAENA